MRKFREFVDKKARETKRELGILKQVLERSGFKVTDHSEQDDPNLFVKSTNTDLSFEGIRIYKIGNDLAFRIQKFEDTHPYGNAYVLGVEDMFNDLLSDEINEEKAGKQVIEAVAKEINKFFEKSAEAEKELSAGEIDGKDLLSKTIAIRSYGTDYANTITSKVY